MTDVRTCCSLHTQTPVFGSVFDWEIGGRGRRHEDAAQGRADDGDGVNHGHRL